MEVSDKGPRGHGCGIHPNVEGNAVRMEYRVPHTFAVFCECVGARRQSSGRCVHHKQVWRPSQTRNRDRAIIPRQCSIENCARLQRRTHHPPQNHFRRLFDKWTTSGRQVDEKCSRSGNPAPRKVHAKPQKPQLSPYSCRGWN